MHAEEKCKFCNGWCKLGDYLESGLEGVTIKEMRQWLRKSVSIQQSKQLPIFFDYISEENFRGM